MKKLLININSKIKIKIPKELKNKKVGLLTTSQYLNQAKEIAKENNFIFGGQVLGCNANLASKISNKVDAFFLLTEGRFHALEIAIQTEKEVYIASGDKITKEEIKKHLQKKKSLLTRFFAARRVGILVSTKPGQNNLKAALELKKKLEKETYLFTDNTFNIPELENFNTIDMFINTACPRIEGRNIIQLRDVQNAINN
jgi:2-(3-amino-3-carboxypropyl)histidine synthase